MAQQQWSAPPAMQIDVAKDYSVSIETNRGTIELDALSAACAADGQQLRVLWRAKASTTA